MVPRYNTKIIVRGYGDKRKEYWIMMQIQYDHMFSGSKLPNTLSSFFIGRRKLS